MKKQIIILTSLFSIIVLLSACTGNFTLPMPEAPFSKGINVANALEAPNEGDWGVVIQDWFFQEITAKGFDVVRIPIGWHHHITEKTNMTIDNRFFERVEHVVQQAISNDLKVILSFHSFEDFYTNPMKNTFIFTRIWEQITERFLNRYPDQLFFELLNEPHGGLSSPVWNQIQLETLSTIREIDAERWVIITGANWGNGQSLVDVQLPTERYKLLATFHLYEPFLFTHQGVPWLDEAYSTTGVIWPGPPPYYLSPSEAATNYPEVVKWFDDYNTYPYPFNPAGPAPITQELHSAMQWSKSNNIPTFLGEFGTYEKIDQQSRSNWTKFVRKTAEEMDFSWIYWDFAGHFKTFNLDTLQWNADIVEALGVISPTNP